MRRKIEMMAQVAFLIAAIFSLSPWATSGMALVLGMFLGLVIGNPYPERTRSWTPRLLQLSIVGLGAGMDLKVVGRVGISGLGYTAVGIALTLAIGGLLGHWLRTERRTSVLISSGTAICGGSAIAAVSSAIGANAEQTAVALATVFILNSAALLLFPWLGHLFHLNQHQFGIWAALAIHDTSSVVGASLQYGYEALQTATPMKLARALWIIPLTFTAGIITKGRLGSPGPGETTSARLKLPWFILGFLLMAALATAVPELQKTGQQIATGARHLLVFTLFLIGSALNRPAIKKVGIRPFGQAFVLWLIVGTGTLGSILMGWVN